MAVIRILPLGFGIDITRVPAVDGVVRWRRKDLARWLLETSHLARETTVGRELKALGFAKISAGRATTRKTSWPSRLFPAATGRGSRKASR